MFELHPRLAEDCILMGRFPLCRLLLMNDANYPWFILVPERVDVREIYELDEEDQVRLIVESSQLSRQLASYFHADKMNVAALGNMVPQLHVHHIVRYRNDPAWPEPVWGRVALRPYGPEDAAGIRNALRGVLGDGFVAADGPASGR